MSAGFLDFADFRGQVLDLEQIHDKIAAEINTSLN